MKAIAYAYIIGGLNRGAVLCHLTTVIIMMHTIESKYKYTLTTDIISLLSIAAFIGSIVGTLLQPRLVKKFGRYNTLRIVAVLSFVMNALCMPHIHWGYLFVFKFMAGLTTVMQVTIVPAIGGEVLDSKVRGVVGSFLNISLQLAMIICNIIQFIICLHPNLYPVSLVFPCTMSVLMIILTFMMREEKPKADVEMQNTQTQEAINNQTQIPVTESIFQKKYIKSFVVAITMGMAVGAAGITPVLQYSTIIFKTTFKSKKSGTIGGIITSSESLVSALIMMPLIKRFKRKTLFITGLTLMLLCYIALIIVLYLDLEKTTSNNSVLCITAAMIFGYNISGASLFYIIIGEVFPQKIKTIASAIAMATVSVCVIIQTYVFPHLKQQENYIFYLVWMIIVYFLVIFVIPETSNKTLEEIEMEMIPKKYHAVKEVKIEPAIDTANEQNDENNEPEIQELQDEANISDRELVVSPSVTNFDQ
ncbi:Sugar_(And other) transporter family protein [Hexamita inflata]|uniref:Sugar (And other) transporter family protein n=1 Tax=Hexamita inflata TaxID=28002 RepID=A0AA86PB20_9EUKA|nr:Sugar (And other) transporter family protein [Hexamita inflata]CAI9949647.1 Sugar (And other) transporter family protein [Hexamita inflata]